MKQNTECHEMFTCRLDAGICNNKQPWNGDKCRCECEELIDKGVCHKDFIWNPSNCECECDKSCDNGEFLDYKNCKCRKRLINKLVDECTENVEKVKLAKITSAKYENMHKCSSCTLYIVLFSIIFTINVRIGTYFVYFYWYSKKDVTCVKFGFHTREVKQIRITNRTYYFYKNMINLKNFNSNLLKIDKSITKGLIFTTLDTS